MVCDIATGGYRDQRVVAEMEDQSRYPNCWQNGAYIALHRNTSNALAVPGSHRADPPPPTTAGTPRHSATLGANLQKKVAIVAEVRSRRRSSELRQRFVWQSLGIVDIDESAGKAVDHDD